MNYEARKHIISQMSNSEKVACVVELTQSLLNDAHKYSDVEGFNAFMLHLIKAKNVYEYHNTFLGHLKEHMDHNVLNGTFTSVWDDGVEVTTHCKVNMDTHEVFDIDFVQIEGLEDFRYEYITVANESYKVTRMEDADESDVFWYE